VFHRLSLTNLELFIQGLIVLTIQAHVPSLKPTKCDGSTPCDEVNGGKEAMLFAGLYLVALGVGGIKGSLPVHGGEQFDESTPNGRKQRSTFFNYFVFCLSCGALIAVTFVVWVEDNKGWEWGFAISTISIFLSIPVFLAGSTTYRNKLPSGSPLTTILKVTYMALVTIDLLFIRVLYNGRGNNSGCVTMFDIADNRDQMWRMPGCNFRSIKHYYVAM
jgi:dipeptide/tripeptide permease